MNTQSTGHATVYRFVAKRFNSAGEHVGIGRWIDLIHLANALTFGGVMFDTPDKDRSGDGLAYYVERYPHAVVRHCNDGAVEVHGTDDYGDRVLRAAYAALCTIPDPAYANAWLRDRSGDAAGVAR